MNELFQKIVEHYQTHSHHAIDMCPMIVSRESFVSMIHDDTLPLWLSPEDRLRICDIEHGKVGTVFGVPLYIFPEECDHDPTDKYGSLIQSYLCKKCGEFYRG